MNCRSTAAFIRSPRQLLQSDTGDPHFALDPLTYRCLLSLSPAADFAEPRPPRHTHIKLKPTNRTNYDEIVAKPTYGFATQSTYLVNIVSI